MIRYARVLAALAFLAAPPAMLRAQDAPPPAPPGMARVETVPREVTVGDRVTATVILVWDGADPAETPRFPAFQERWGDAEVLASGAVESFRDEGARRIYRQEVTLAAFRPGEVDLPPVTLAVPLADTTVEVRTPADAGFVVRSLLPPAPEAGTDDEATAGDDAATAEEPALRPAAPPVELAGDGWFGWVLAGWIVAALVTAWWAVRRLARTSPRLATLLRLDPTSEVRAALRRIDPGVGEKAHTALSLALRIYLGRRLGFPAVESTTSELHRRLRRTPVDDHAARRLVELLRDCDQVKFARRDVSPEVTARRLEIAGALVDDVERAVVPPEPARQEAA